MPKVAFLTPATAKGKKWKVVLAHPTSGKPKWKKIKTIQFGQKGASDYTKHKNKRRKAQYLARHKKREDWSDPKTAGFWSRWLTWNKPTLKASMTNIKKRFGIIVKQKSFV